jgi:hypothetical protein
MHAEWLPQIGAVKVLFCSHRVLLSMTVVITDCATRYYCLTAYSVEIISVAVLALLGDKFFKRKNKFTNSNNGILLSQKNYHATSDLLLFTVEAFLT